MLKEKLDMRQDLQHYLYRMGFLITNKELSIAEYPFYENWGKTNVKGYNFLIHNQQKLFLYEKDNKVYFLIGHAYNPFKMLSDEYEILEDVAEDEGSFYEKLNELTGVFIIGYINESAEIVFTSDATSMQQIYYGMNDQRVYISSHSALIGDICNLKMTKYVEELINYKYYRLFGLMLPGDITAYDGFYRVIPNISVTYRIDYFDIYRFYEIKTYNHSEIDYEEIIGELGNILHNNMELIAKKWERPAISMTGGCDSKTTLSCTNGLYDQFQYFSYSSSPEEQVDVEAAKKICEKLNLNHTEYQIPLVKEKDYALFKEIIESNLGRIGDTTKENEIIKRIFLTENNDFDVEVKSWVSEVARAYFYKRFDKNRFPVKPTPRYMTSLYKVFFNNRKLVKQTDKIFEAFLEKYYRNISFENGDWTEMFFWEFRVGAWNGLVISGEHKIAFDITIPYNNRKLLELFLMTPLEKRTQDQPHKDIQKLMNSQIYDMNISVTNVKHTLKRAKMERVYLGIHSRIPF